MMRKAFPFLFLFLAFILSVPSVFAQSNISGDNVWQEVDKSVLTARPVEHRPLPANYRSFKMSKSAMDSILNSAPKEFSGTNLVSNSANSVILTMPMPDGSYQRFRIEHSPIVESGLSAKFPELSKTYRGQGIDDPTATARFDFLPTGFHSMILSPRGTVLIDPFAKGNTEDYISFYKRDGVKTNDFVCRFDQEKSIESMLSSGFDANDFLPETSENVISGTQLRTYRLALAATGEYTAAVGGGTVAGALAAQVLIMNRVNGVYERDVAIRMVIIANNNLIVYTDGATDPYTNNNGSTMLSQNQTNLDSVIGTANYDIGHVFSTGGGGVAFLGVPCGSSKAGGVTGLPNPIGDDFAIDYVAHEMGHQWGANHTFNSTTSNCGGGNRSGTSAYEPGSGITIMAYAGICGNQNLAPHSIDTFHVKSLEVIVAYSQTGNGNTCAVTTSTGNTPPTVTAPASFNIPKLTPFTLTASASDVNGDSLTYDWQEYALGASTTTVPNTDATGARPILRPYLPTTSPSRTFPSLQYILNNANVPPSTTSCGTGTCLTGELLPQIGGRTIPFQVVVRDNRANGGGINTATTNVIVDSTAGPFAITAPNTATTIAGGSSTTVTWNVSGTTAAPVSASDVKISLSTDGGQTFPTVLAASTANDGTESVTLPNVATTQARIKVEAVGNIFFDISDANFTITASAPSSSKPYDFDGDGKDDVSVYRGGNWYLLNSTTGFASVGFGVSTDKTVAGDYDGDNKTDVAVFRDGTWFVLRSSNNAVSIVNFGQAGDTPMVGDYDGDGKADYTVFRAGNWYTLKSSDGGFTATSFGIAGDKPVSGRFDADNKTDIAVFRNGTWYILNSSNGAFSAIAFGAAGDIPVAADYDGDGKTDAAVFRSGNWYILGSTAGFSAVNFGIATDTPTPADYDGDNKADISVFRAGTWYRLNSSNGAFFATAFGLSGDKPVPAQLQ